MKILINKLLHFMANVHRKTESESAKRVYGGIGYLSAIAYIGLFRNDLVSDLLVVSASLIFGATLNKTFRQIFSKK